MDLIKLNEEIDKQFEEVDKQFQHLNMIVVGKTGVGKSTLLNACFGKKLAETGNGEPVTQEIKCHQLPNYPLRIYDTVGLELGNADSCSEEINSLYDKMIKKGNLDDFIHVMWYCISSEGSRYEDFEITFIEKMSEKLPVIVVLTKTQDKKNGKELKEKLSEKIKCKIVIVRSEPYEIEDEENEGNQITLKSFGLEELLKETTDLIPEAQKKALASSQIIDLKMKEEQAKKVVVRHLTINSIGSFIPWSDIAVILPSNVLMLHEINKIYGIKMSQDLLGDMVGACGAMLITRLPIIGLTNLIKMIPVIGTVTGGLCSMGSVLALTDAIGDVYIEIVNNLYKGILKEEEMRQQSFITKFAESVKRKISENKFLKKKQ